MVSMPGLSGMSIDMGICMAMCMATATATRMCMAARLILVAAFNSASTYFFYRGHFFRIVLMAKRFLEYLHFCGWSMDTN